MRFAAGIGVFALLVGLSGCEGGGQKTSAFASPATASAFCQQAEMLGLARTIQCYGGTAADWPILFGESSCAKLDQAVADHKVTYDASKAAACLTDLSKAVACASIWPESCVPSVLVGAVADGQPCDTGYVCARHSTCEFPLVSDSCPTQICRHTPALGEPCDYICQVGSTCVKGTCLANLKGGATCGMDGQAFCDAGLSCAPTAPASCRPLTVEGGSCVASSECWDHQYCDSTKHCHNRLAMGGDCSADSTSCQAFTACDPSTHKCVAASHLGELCGNILGYPNLLCGGGACLPDANQVSHCVTPVDDGGACAHEYECQSGACTNGICATIPSNDGAACTKPEDCTSGICNDTTGVCTAKSADGADCTNDGFCMSGWCSGGKCTPPAANGLACADGSNCASGHCAVSMCAACP